MKKIILLLIVIFFYLIGHTQSYLKISHRGGRGLMPENTIIAMQNALDFGTQLELDLYLSKDDQVFVYHDASISPVFATNRDGSPVTKEQAVKRPIQDYTYKELKAFDIGTRYSAEVPRKKKVSAYIPLFSELIDSTESYANRAGLPLPIYYPELKYSSKKMPPAYKERLTDAAMKIIFDKKINDRVVVQCFDVSILEYLHKKYPTIKTLYLVFVGMDNYKTNLKKLSFKPYAYSPYYKQITKELVDYCHQQTIKVITWTVNTKEEIDQLKALNVDGIMSDYPDYLKQ